MDNTPINYLWFFGIFGASMGSVFADADSLLTAIVLVIGITAWVSTGKKE